MNKTRCPYLFVWEIFSSCMVHDEPYSPSHFEYKEYCSNTMHRKCPFYLKAATEKSEAFASLSSE